MIKLAQFYSQVTGLDDEMALGQHLTEQFYFKNCAKLFYFIMIK